MATLPFFAWDSLEDQTTCTPVFLSWFFEGDPDITIDISLTNIDVPQEFPTTDIPEPTQSPDEDEETTTSRRPITFSNDEISIRRRQDTSTTPTSDPSPTPSPSQIQFLVEAEVDAFLEEFEWRSLTAPEGYYQFIGASPDGSINIRSPTFFVRNGTDVTCLPVVVPPELPSSTVSTTAAPTSTPSSEPSDGGGGEGGGGSSSSSNPGAIAGGVVGGLAFLAIIACVIFLLRRRKNSRRAFPVSSVAGGPGGGAAGTAGSVRGSKHKKGGKWGGLSSVDSIAGSNDRRGSFGISNPQPPIGRNSFPGTVAMTDRRPSIRSAAVTDEDELEKTSPASGLDSGENGTFTFTPAALGYQYSSSDVDSRRRSSQRSSFLPPALHSDPLYPSSVSNIGAEDDFLFPDRSTDLAKHQAPSAAPPITTTPAASPGEEKPKYRTPRKRVPSYTPSTISGIGATPSTEPNPPLPATTPSPIPSLSGSASGHGHYAIGNGRSPNNDAHQFGKDGQVHFLMPDFPASRS